MFNAIAYSVAQPMAGERTNLELIRRSPDKAPVSYRWLSKEQQARADEATMQTARFD